MRNSRRKEAQIWNVYIRFASHCRNALMEEENFKVVEVHPAEVSDGSEQSYKPERQSSTGYLVIRGGEHGKGVSNDEIARRDSAPVSRR